MDCSFDKTMYGTMALDTWESKVNYHAVTLEWRFSKENAAKKTKIKLIHEGEYVVAVPVELVEPAPAWELCLPLKDAVKLDDTRSALKRGDLETAGKYGKVYHLVPLTA